jgi:enoyl-CoA hydratase/carnithine racemase
MEKKLVLVEKKDMIGVITLNRPEAMNTFNVPFARALNDALLDLDRDDEVRVVVIRAAGKHFSTGISLPEFKGKNQKELREFLNLMDEFYHTLPRMKKPVIASVKGAAVANGAGLVFACDMAIAAENAKFGTCHQRRTHLPGSGRTPGAPCRPKESPGNGPHRRHYLGCRSPSTRIDKQNSPPGRS